MKKLCLTRLGCIRTKPFIPYAADQHQNGNCNISYILVYLYHLELIIEKLNPTNHFFVYKNKELTNTNKKQKHLNILGSQYHSYHSA